MRLPRDYDTWRLEGPDDFTDGGFDDAEAERMANDMADALGDYLYERKREDQMEGRKE
jgi:hypothetical protein